MHVSPILAIGVGGCYIEAKDCFIKVKDCSIRINHPSVIVCDCFIRAYQSFSPFLCLYCFSDVSK